MLIIIILFYIGYCMILLLSPPFGAVFSEIDSSYELGSPGSSLLACCFLETGFLVACWSPVCRFLQACLLFAFQARSNPTTSNQEEARYISVKLRSQEEWARNRTLFNEERLVTVSLVWLKCLEEDIDNLQTKENEIYLSQKSRDRVKSSKNI